MSDAAWTSIANSVGLLRHNFADGPLVITAEQIKTATAHYKKTNEREVRILCKQDSREDRPAIFKEHGLFLLPVHNGSYAILRGEGYIDIPDISGTASDYHSKLDFPLDTSEVGNSEMQHLDFAYASSLIRTYFDDLSLVLTIRGRKYTPKFSLRVGDQRLEVDGVQTEVDAGYEGRNRVVLIEAKNAKTTNVIIRQLYYPFRQWQHCTAKPVHTVFFERRSDEFLMWEFRFSDTENYNSVRLTRSQRFRITAPRPSIKKTQSV